MIFREFQENRISLKSSQYSQHLSQGQKALKWTHCSIKNKKNKKNKIKLNGEKKTVQIKRAVKKATEKEKSRMRHKNFAHQCAARKRAEAAAGGVAGA